MLINNLFVRCATLNLLLVAGVNNCMNEI